MNFIIILLLITFLLLILKILNIQYNNIKLKSNNTYTFEKISYISNILSNCSISRMKSMKISNNIEYVKYMNYLSCMCKGIGYWGGFCLKKEKIYVGGNKAHDISLSNELAELFKDKTVVDLGAGLGWYCPIISKKSKQCDQYDGSINIEEVTNGKVKYLNLAEPIQFECKYDIVMSLEVAEHIPKKYEEVYVNNLVKCSKSGLLITWSRIGQSGHFHVNNKNKEDVIILFENKGLKYNSKITNKLKNITKIWWLRNNILFFTKEDYFN